MTERVLLLLSQPSVLEALRSDDLLDTLGEISPLSDLYLPTLQFFMRPGNLVTLVSCLLEEPPSKSRSTRFVGVEPTYEDYAIVYRAHWVLCASGFSSQLHSAILGLHQFATDADTDAAVDDPMSPHAALCARLVACNSRDPMILEALTRFLNAFMDQYSPETWLGFLGPRFALPFVQTLLTLLHYEPIRDVLLRLCNELPETAIDWRRGHVVPQLLHQLSPLRPRGTSGTVELDDAVVSRIHRDPPHVQFSRSIFTCDLLTDLIHERRQATLGFALIQDLYSDDASIDDLLGAAAWDLGALPNVVANESYVLKVLNSLLQQSQCGCVSKIAFVVAGPSTTAGVVDPPPPDDTLQSPHVDLPRLWKAFQGRLVEFLGHLVVGPARQYKSTHIQLIYLMLPLLNVACHAVDRELIRLRTMETLVAFLVRFPRANILHCAISRLFIVALEDSPFMFGKELPAFRAANDPLRLHLLLRGCFEAVMDAFEQPLRADATTPTRPPPPAFIDIAISFDQAVTNAHAHSPQLFAPAVMERWAAFRARVLIPTQSAWEEQCQVAPTSPGRAFGLGGMFDSGDEPHGGSAPVGALDLCPPPSSGATHVSVSDEPMKTTTMTTSSTPRDPMTSSTLSAPASASTTVDAAAVVAKAEGEPSAPQWTTQHRDDGTPPPVTSTVTRMEEQEDIPTPLSALYNEEEKHLMHKVAGGALLSSSSGSGSGSSLPSSAVPTAVGV